MTNIFKLENTNDRELHQRLFAFEKQFDYPLGNGDRFYIDHSPDYKAFYQAIGRDNIVIVEKDNQIIATISSSIREITINDKVEKVVYIGDLKIHPNYQSSRVLYKLINFLKSILEREASLAYCVVMEGTKITPKNYTGRLGIPTLAVQERINLIKFITNDYQEQNLKIITEEEGYGLYCTLHNSSPLINYSNAKIRSLIAPTWFNYNNQACAMIEDTRKAKKLFLENGSELISAHISYFSYADQNSAFTLLKHCIGYAYRHDFPIVFLALSRKQKDDLKEVLKNFTHQELSATIYSNDRILENITINSSEI